MKNMKKIMQIYLALTLFIMGQNAHAGDLTIVIENLEDKEGYLEIALYDSEDHYAKQETPTRRLYVPAAEATPRGFSFKNLPEGFYAVAIYHDENKNGQFDQTFFGWPKEGFGFSRGAKPVFDLPDFGETSFYLARNARAREGIVLRYLDPLDYESWLESLQF